MLHLSLKREKGSMALPLCTLVAANKSSNDFDLKCNTPMSESELLKIYGAHCRTEFDYRPIIETKPLIIAEGP